MILLKKMVQTTLTNRTQHGHINLCTNPMSIPPSINFHITQRCNYHCKFCFARYRGHHQELSLKQSKRLIDIISNAGVRKINFAGGEPTLDSRLANLVNYAASKGLYVSIISNGTGINSELLKNTHSSLNMIGISIDSASSRIERCLGRYIDSTSRQFHNHVKMAIRKADLIREYNIPLKINTTVTPLNVHENMSDLIIKLKPVRWKVFQVHQINGVNNQFFHEAGISSDKDVFTQKFMKFVQRHSHLRPIYETNELMTESYLMITPDGCLYQNTDGSHTYSSSILKNGFSTALNEINFSISRFQQRSGDFFLKKEKEVKV